MARDYRSERRDADRAKMAADRIAELRHKDLMHREQFKEHFQTIKPNFYTGHTELSAMYDNDGNPIHDEPKGYLKD